MPFTPEQKKAIGDVQTSIRGVMVLFSELIVRQADQEIRNKQLAEPHWRIIRNPKKGRKYR